MKAPAFWGVAAKGKGRFLSVLLLPLSYLYRGAGLLREKFTSPYKLGIPVVCVGNLTVGGTGKTPVALAFGKYLLSCDIKLHYLSRGYGGHMLGPIKVDCNAHTAKDVGDEPLLLATVAPTWVSKDRVVGAKAAVAAGAKLIIMDDGFQNPSLQKDLSFIVVDAGVGFGNGAVLPAGPLRETVGKGLSRADAAILIGDGEMPVELEGIATYRARLKPIDVSQFGQGNYLAFAGIGRPEKFFNTLQRSGIKMVGNHSFADHYTYTNGDLKKLHAEAKKHSAKLITTEKDFARLTPDQRKDVAAFPVVLYWDENNSPYDLLMKALSDG